jgi:hypothetical protein
MLDAGGSAAVGTGIGAGGETGRGSLRAAAFQLAGLGAVLIIVAITIAVS